ncbi:hypothetical protein P4V33_09300 [Brevibacillus borstelensis]|uniref:hypothetical protein n=1 Tax=Brevibacillus borstelensis TaxID=45462 RepID=UPI002E1B043F|nr:hypothetical protein [Brevibacillus borstelensis]
MLELGQTWNLIITVMIGIVAYFLRRLDRQIMDNDRDRKREIDELRNDFDEMKEKMPFTYVLREDYIRSMAAFGNKLDKIHEHIVLNKDKG